MVFKKIRWNYCIFIFSVIITIVFNQSIIQYDISQQSEDALLINLAGRQRMLSQRIAKRVLYFQNEIHKNPVIDPANVDTLQKLINEFEKIHYILLNGDKKLELKGLYSPTINNLLAANTPLLQNIVRACKKVNKQTDARLVDSVVTVIEKYELKFLLKMENVVNTFVDESNAKLNHLRWVELALACLSIGILLLEFVFIFQPLMLNLGKTNESLQQSNDNLYRVSQELKAIFDSTQVSIIVADVSGNITHFNKGAERMLGYKAAEILHQHTPMLVHLEEEIIQYGKELSEKYQKDIRGFEVFTKNALHHQTESKQWTYVRKDGTNLQVQLVVSAIFDSQNKAVGFLGIATDINELIKAKEELYESKETLEILANKLTKQNGQLLSFAHIISHNLRSPVSNLNSLLFLHEESQDLAEKALLFSKFKIVIHHLSETLNELIETLKIQEDTEIEKEEITFVLLFEKIQETFAGTLLETKAQVTADFGRLPAIIYPKVYLESILLNLFSNALKYRSPERIPTIHLQTDCIDGNEILTISDNGLGIDMQKHGHKLFGLRKTFHRHAEAKGLGLFITKTQIEAMGGSISVESEENKGSTFKIIFNQQT